MEKTLDAVVVGGGPAGLQAGLTLGRMHLDTVVLDAGPTGAGYRNDPADAMHNLIGHDGQKPAELRAAARADLAAYACVELREQRVDRIGPACDSEGFTVTTPDGILRTRAVVLATGLRDILPETPGLADVFGSVAAHCPFCHGHEYAGGHVAFLGHGPHTTRLVAMMGRIAERRTVLADGAAVPDDALATLRSLGAEVRPERVLAVEPAGEGARVRLEGGDEVAVDGMFVATTLAQAAPFAEQLGLDMQESGAIRVDGFGRTSRPGVYAAGDLAHADTYPMAVSAVAAAIAAGQIAAATVVADLVARELEQVGA